MQWLTYLDLGIESLSGNLLSSGSDWHHTQLYIHRYIRVMAYLCISICATRRFTTKQLKHRTTFFHTNHRAENLKSFLNRLIQELVLLSLRKLVKPSPLLDNTFNQSNRCYQKNKREENALVWTCLERRWEIESRLWVRKLRK